MDEQDYKEVILDSIDEYEGTLLADQLRQHLERNEIQVAYNTIRQMDAITKYINEGVKDMENNNG